MGTHRQPLTRLNAGSKLPSHPDAHANKQDTRLLIALTLLLVALTVVLVKDREFWFGWDEVSMPTVSAPATIANTDSAAKTASAPVARPEVAPSTPNKKSSRVSAPAPAAQSSASQPAAESSITAASDAPVVATNRVVLPPLDVEVISGDSHHVVRPGSNATKVEIPTNSNRLSPRVSIPTNASVNERLGAHAELRQTIDSYPVLTPQSRVQGSVVLQALVGADGSIEHLQVVSGPSILVAAAQQAVREWRFKPYVENGQAVETKARITVNFTIKVSDNSKAS